MYITGSLFLKSGMQMRIDEGVELRGVQDTKQYPMSYSYAKIPDGIKDYPEYWKVLTTPVPAEKGLPRLHGVRIST